MRSLSAHLSGPELAPLGRRIALLRDVAEAMHFLHALPRPILHRDLKSDNVLLSGDFRAVVCDFGLAQTQHTSQTRTRASRAAGTLFYMAPELLSLSPKWSTKS